MKALGKTMHSEVSLLECVGRICHMSFSAGWAGSLAPGKCSSTQSLALLLPQAHKSLSLHFPSFLMGWHCRVAARSRNRVLHTGAKDGRKLPPLLAFTTSGEINTPSVILRQFRELFYFLKTYFHTQGTDF